MEVKDLLALGFTAEQVMEKVIERIEESVMARYIEVEDPDVGPGQERRPSRFQELLEKAVMAKIDEAVRKIADKHVLPKGDEILQKVVFQETNKWGEKTGKPVTFMEYLEQKAELYFKEPVDYQGKSKSENSWGSWEAKTTRGVYMVENHLRHHIEEFAKKALGNATTALAGSIQKAVLLALQDVEKKLGLQVVMTR